MGFIFRFFVKLFVFVFIVTSLVVAGLYYLPKQYYKQALEVAAFTQGVRLDIKGDLLLEPSADAFLTMTDVDVDKNLGGGNSVAATLGKLSVFKKGWELDRVEIAGTKFSYNMPASEASYDFSNVNASISLPLQGRPLDAKGDAVIKGQRVNFDAFVADPVALQEGRESKLRAKLSSKFLNAAFNGKQKKEAISGNLAMDSASLEGVSGWLSDFNKVGGSGKLDMDFSIDGGDLTTLNGKGRLALKNVTQKYTNEDINTLVVKFTGKNTQIDDLTATFDIKDGVINNQDLKGVGPAVFSGKGIIDLARMTIDYKITPEVKISSVETVPQLNPPIRLVGSLFDPEVKIEAQDIIKDVVGKPQQIIKTVTDVITDNAAGKQIKSDLQGLRDKVTKDTDVQKQLLDNLLGAGTGDSLAPVLDSLQKPKAQPQPPVAPQQPASAAPVAAPQPLSPAAAPPVEAAPSAEEAAPAAGQPEEEPTPAQ